MLHPTHLHPFALVRWIKMSHSYLEASARSITFSKAIRYELTRKLEEPVPSAATSYDDTSDAISEAILWQIEQTFNTVPTREVPSDDKCKRFALTLSDDEMIGDEDGMILLQATSSPLVEQDSMAKSRSKHGSFISYSQFHSEDCSPYRPSGDNGRGAISFWTILGIYHLSATLRTQY
jgi:hypothetical protein